MTFTMRQLWNPTISTGTKEFPITAAFGNESMNTEKQEETMWDLYERLAHTNDGRTVQTKIDYLGYLAEQRTAEKQYM